MMAAAARMRSSTASGWQPAHKPYTVRSITNLAGTEQPIRCDSFIDKITKPPDQRSSRSVMPCRTSERP